MHHGLYQLKPINDLIECFGFFCKKTRKDSSCLDSFFLRQSSPFGFVVNFRGLQGIFRLNINFMRGVWITHAVLFLAQHVSRVAWSNNEIIKGVLLVLKFSFRLTSFLHWAVTIRILGFICAPVWGSWLSQPRDISSFCEGEPFETWCGPELKRNPSVSLKARQGVQWEMTGWCLRGVWGPASIFPLKGTMGGKKAEFNKN